MVGRLRCSGDSPGGIRDEHSPACSCSRCDPHVQPHPPCYCRRRSTRLPAPASVKEGEGNADGGISAEKHASAASKRFEIMDKDKNGKITAAEINSSHGAESIVWANHPEVARRKDPQSRCEPRRRTDGLGIFRRLAEDVSHAGRRRQRRADPSGNDDRPRQPLSGLLFQCFPLPLPKIGRGFVRTL